MLSAIQSPHIASSQTCPLCTKKNMYHWIKKNMDIKAVLLKKLRIVLVLLYLTDSIFFVTSSYALSCIGKWNGTGH